MGSAKDRSLITGAFYRDRKSCLYESRIVGKAGKCRIVIAISPLPACFKQTEINCLLLSMLSTPINRNSFILELETSICGLYVYILGTVFSRNTEFLLNQIFI